MSRCLLLNEELLTLKMYVTVVSMEFITLLLLFDTLLLIKCNLSNRFIKSIVI